MQRHACFGKSQIDSDRSCLPSFITFYILLIGVQTMQTWRRQPTQCIFCAFRQTTASTRPQAPTREFSTVDGKRQGYGQKERRLGFDRVNQYVDSNGTFRNKTPAANKRRTYGQDDRRLLKGSDDRPLIRRDGENKSREDAFRPANTERDFSELAKKRENLWKLKLSELHRTLEQEKVLDGTDEPVSKLQKLDPDGTRWKAFCDFMISLPVRAKSPNVRENEKSLWNILSNASGIALQKEIYFAFLDFILKPLDTKALQQGSGSVLCDLRYPTEWYTMARTTQRTIHLHVGPTNSGKTYHALKRLQEAKNGFYAGPLRLLAHEVYTRFQAAGIPCDLVTGDDVRLDDHKNTAVAASTVEMVNTGRGADVAVIDEIQMMGDEDRGWAWTRAVLGANATEVHLCGEERVVPLVRELAASMGDSLKIHNYKRLNPLKCMTRSLRGNIKLLKKGDCIVAFSIMELHALRRQIELETTKRCAIVYGSLPPEVRAQQADLFNDPDNDYDFLVASDAIGMGLNLSVKRIIFASSSKFDGQKRVQLSIPQIKQIAGRAGRYRSARQANTGTAVKDDEENVGLVTTLDEDDLPVIRNALMTEAPPLKQAGILPPAEYMEEFASTLPINVPFEYLMRKVCHVATTHPRFFLCDVRDKLRNARLVDDVPGLSIEQRVIISASPLGHNDTKTEEVLKAIARCIATNRAVTVVDIPEIPLEVLAIEPSHDRKYLTDLEQLHKALILYLWLSYRFPATLREQPMAQHAKDLVERKINHTLKAFSANPKLRQRLKRMQQKPVQEERMIIAGTDVTEAFRRKDVTEQASELGSERANQDSGVEAGTYNPEQQSSIGNLTEMPKEDISQLLPMDGDETVEEHFRKPDLESVEHTEGQETPERVSNLDVAGHEEELEQNLPVSEEERDQVVHGQDRSANADLGAALPEQEPERSRAAGGSG